MAKAKAESGEEVHPQQPLSFLRRHLVPPSTSGSIVVFPFVVMPHLKENREPKLIPPHNIALYFDPTQSKKVVAAPAGKKRTSDLQSEETQSASTPSILSFGWRLKCLSSLQRCFIYPEFLLDSFFR